MINTLLVAASLKALEEILQDNDIPYEIYKDEASDMYQKLWETADAGEKALKMRQARPAIKRIIHKEPYVFIKSGGPLVLKFNDASRRMRDSFGEMLIEREDLDWRIAFSIKNDARIIASAAVADRHDAEYDDHTVNVYNVIDDFGERIFGVPCTNDYFQDMNAILEQISHDGHQEWVERFKDDDFAYNRLITPMLSAIAREIPRICKDHPEAPAKLLDFFYSKYDYYFINPIDELEITRIGAINVHHCLGCIPNNKNHYTATVDAPTELLEVRFATGPHGEISRDTIQLNFDGGWAVCLTIIRNENEKYGRFFAVKAYLPVTPFGSYRDQVKWEPEA